MPKKILFTSTITPYLKAENLVRPLWPAYLAAYAEKKFGGQTWVEYNMEQSRV